MTEYHQKGLIQIMFSLHNKLDEINNSALVEVHKLNELNFSLLEAKLSVTKQVNTLLSSRFISIVR